MLCKITGCNRAIHVQTLEMCFLHASRYYKGRELNAPIRSYKKTERYFEAVENRKKTLDYKDDSIKNLLRIIKKNFPLYNNDIDFLLKNYDPHIAHHNEIKEIAELSKEYNSFNIKYPYLVIKQDIYNGKSLFELIQNKSPDIINCLNHIKKIFSKN